MILRDVYISGKHLSKNHVFVSTLGPYFGNRRVQVTIAVVEEILLIALATSVQMSGPKFTGVKRRVFFFSVCAR